MGMHLERVGQFKNLMNDKRKLDVVFGKRAMDVLDPDSLCERDDLQAF